MEDSEVTGKDGGEQIWDGKGKKKGVLEGDEEYGKGEECYRGREKINLQSGSDKKEKDKKSSDASAKGRLGKKCRAVQEKKGWGNTIGRLKVNTKGDNTVQKNRGEKNAEKRASVDWLIEDEEVYLTHGMSLMGSCQEDGGLKEKKKKRTTEEKGSGKTWVEGGQGDRRNRASFSRGTSSSGLPRNRLSAIPHFSRRTAVGGGGVIGGGGGLLEAGGKEGGGVGGGGRGRGEGGGGGGGGGCPGGTRFLYPRGRV